MLGLFVAMGVVGALLLGYALLVAAPNLPSLDVITDYRPKIPLRVYTADNVLIGEFGEERRSFVPIAQIPDVMKRAVLAIEDDRFYEHGGVDFVGVLRAGLANLHGGLSQGASTITMQVARNFFLSSEKTFTRKIYEMLLAYKIERALTALPAPSRSTSARTSRTSPWPKPPCWPACRKRRRRTTRW